ncbi:TELO2-interacting protein 2-like [Mercenaria mercenaria]|uniref:TELO2-interacting protein 2-like n=1 Tax=Mercenaria mercenaria TaxID=6596 RepID=UPI00234E3D4F|nr:TELO2-interacting protein 2-like [Mercenaria mercenaria]
MPTSLVKVFVELFLEFCRSDEMSVDLRALLCKVNVVNGCFRTSMDKAIAKDIYERHSLQNLLEVVSHVSRDTSINRIFNEKYIVILTVLVENGPDSWIRIFIDGFNDSTTQSLCINSVRTISKTANVQAKTEKEQGCFEAADFTDVGKRVCLVLNFLQTLLKRVTLCGRGNKELDTWRCLVQIGYFLFGVAVQHAVKDVWTNSSSETLANDSIHLLLETFGCPSVSVLLVLDTKHMSPIDEDLHYSVPVKKSIIGKLLLQWKPNLQRNTWRQNPAVCSSFSWCLQQLKFPYLSDLIELVLPPCLLFVDDHVAQSKEMGTSCLIHILQNATGEELRWYGRADVIYEALKLQMFTTEDSVLKMTHEALLLTLKVVVKEDSSLGTTSKYDEIFSLILQAASHENKLVLRRIHTHSLHKFIECLGINVVKYMKRLLELVEEYLEVSDAPFEQARLNTLKALKSFIKTAWPRIPSHSETILKILVKLIHQLSSTQTGNSQTVDSQLLTLAVECLELLKGLDEAFISHSMQQLQELPFSENVHVVLQQIMAK